MWRLILTLVLVIAATFVYGYFQQLNPGVITLRISPSTAFEISPANLAVISMATGGLIVVLLVGIRETKNLILGYWKSIRWRRRDETDPYPSEPPASDHTER